MDLAKAHAVPQEDIAEKRNYSAFAFRIDRPA
jgi:hypothetical protein